MKKSVLALATALLLVFSACSKDDDDNGNGNGNDDVIMVPSKTLNGQMKKLLNFNNPEDEIYHIFEDYDLGKGLIAIGDGLTMDFIVATGNVNQDGAVSLSFATEIPADKLTEMFKHSGDIQTSPGDLRTTWHLTNLTLSPEDTQHDPINTWPDFIEELPVHNWGQYETVYYSFVCAEKDGTITGTLNSGHIVDMNVKKGWNIVKISTSEDLKEMVTVNNIPANAFFHYGWQIIY